MREGADTGLHSLHFWKTHTSAILDVQNNQVAFEKGSDGFILMYVYEWLEKKDLKKESVC